MTSLDHSPTGQTRRAEKAFEDARDQLRHAWRHRPDMPADTTAGQSRAGRVTTSTVSDPTSSAASAHEHARTRVRTELVRMVDDLADLLDRVYAPTRRPPAEWSVHARVPDLLALLEQHHRQLATHIRNLDSDPARYDTAKNLCAPLHACAHQLGRLARRCTIVLIQPDAPPGTRVCADDRCQNVLDPSDADLCSICTGRTDRIAEQRAARIAREAATKIAAAAKIAADRAAGTVCAGRHRPDCTRPISDADQSNNRRDCGACRTWATRQPDHVGTRGAFGWHDAR